MNKGLRKKGNSYGTRRETDGADMHGAGDSRDPFADNTAEIAEANSFMLKRISLCAFLNMTLLSLSAPFMGGFSEASWLYVVCGALTGGLSLWAFYRLDRYPKAVTPLFYILLAGLCAYAVALSCFFYPEIHGVTIIGIFMLVPIVTLDKSWRVNLIFFCFCLASRYFALTRKALDLAVDDCVTGGAFMIFGMLIGSYMRRTRLHAIIQQRQSRMQRDYDALTRLPNRRLLFETLGKADSGESSRSLDGMFMIDVDDFKDYNDCNGHQAGDKCLRDLGAFFKAFSQENGVEIFRYGGEEFLGLWYGGSGPGLGQLSDRLVSGELQNESLGGCVTISVGYALRPEGVSSERLISMADSALYEAKRRGKCRAVAYEAPKEGAEPPACETVRARR